jgi:hypothetical protein
MSESTELLKAIHEIRDLLLLIAEPQIAARDQKLRDELVRIVGKSIPKAKSVLLMDGAHTQAAIHTKTSVNQGHLSTLVKQLVISKLVVGDSKQPKLAIAIPCNFFEKTMQE